MRAGVLVVFVAVLAGCAPSPPDRPEEQMATDGPNQVVLKVPGMT